VSVVILSYSARNKCRMELILGNQPSLTNLPTAVKSLEMVPQHQRNQIRTRRNLQSCHRLTEGSDPHSLGHWSYLTITGRPRTITFITAYCPPIQSIESTGPLKHYFQQYNQLRESGVISPNPRQRFFTDRTAPSTPHPQAPRARHYAVFQR
jgi:hypothetical protein